MSNVRRKVQEHQRMDPQEQATLEVHTRTMDKKTGYESLCINLCTIGSHLCIRGWIKWDDKILPKIVVHWEEWLNQVFNVPDIKIPRWTKITPRTSYQIHTFCDASEEGTRAKTQKGIKTTLVAAKSRVTPLKAESISKHELIGCVLGTRLCAAVKETFPASPDDTFFWTDNKVCLFWINLPQKPSRRLSHTELVKSKPTQNRDNGYMCQPQRTQPTLVLDQLQCRNWRKNNSGGTDPNSSPNQSPYGQS